MTEKKVQLKNKTNEINESTTEATEATEANKICKQLMDALTTFIKDYVSNTATELTDELRVEKLVKKTESLAIISKRLEEVKGKLEAGDLRADEAEMLAIEYRKLKKGRKELIKTL